MANVGMESLCSFLQHNKSLIYLDVSHNNMGDRGLYAISGLIQTNSTLQVLWIMGNMFSARSLPRLGQSLSTNTESRLYMLKIGKIECEEEDFDLFVRTGL